MSEEREASALLHTVGVYLLEDHSVLRVGGDDAISWLQGQLTQDVRALSPGHGALTLFLEKTGKVRSDGFVLRRGDELLLVVPTDRAEALRQNLDEHLIMEDVELSLESARVITLQGPLAAGLPVEGREVFVTDRLEQGPGFDVLSSAEGADALLDELTRWAEAEGGGRVHAAGFERARVLAGVPRLDADFGQNTLPQEAGLGRRAVSFTKGCYLGQEAVVMLEHRGQPPKRLARVRTGVALAVGAALTGKNGLAAGTLTSLVPSGDGFVGLALLKRALAVPGSVLEAEGGSLEVQALVE